MQDASIVSPHFDEQIPASTKADDNQGWMNDEALAIEHKIALQKDQTAKLAQKVLHAADEGIDSQIYLSSLCTECMPV